MKKKYAIRNRSMMLYATLLGLVVVLMLTLKMCSHPVARYVDARAGGDTLNVAIEISPVGVNLRGDTLSGFYYDMLREIMSGHGRQVSIAAFNHVENALEGLESGRYDIVIADMPLTAPIKNRYLSTIPVSLDRQVLVQSRDSVTGEIAVSSPVELAGKTVYLPANSPMKQRLVNLANELGDTIYINEDALYGSEQLVMMVALGQIDNVVVNKHVADIMLKDYPSLDASVEISFNQFQGWILAPRDSVLRDTLNSWIERYRDTQAAEELEQRYFTD